MFQEDPEDPSVIQVPFRGEENEKCNGGSNKSLHLSSWKDNFRKDTFHPCYPSHLLLPSLSVVTYNLTAQPQPLAEFPLVLPSLRHAKP